ncbi:hypothetical protein ACA910_007983 [Epithemia clementina (nom. ined.)]
MSANQSSKTSSGLYTAKVDGSEEDYRAELWEFLQESRDMRSAAKSSLKQGLWAGGGAVAGGLMLGPVGGLVGGITGSLVGFFQSDDYDGAVQQLMKLPEVRQNKLLRAVGQVLSGAAGDSGVDDLWESPEVFRRTLAEYAGRTQVRDQIWKLCTEAMKGDDDPSSPATTLTS